MRSDLGKFMQQAQEIQRKMQAARDEMTKQELVGESGAGLVKITISGDYQAKKTEINDAIVPGLSAEDKEMLQDLITAAINNADKKIKASSKVTMPTLPDGFDITEFGNLFKGS